MTKSVKRNGNECLSGRAAKVHMAEHRHLSYSHEERRILEWGIHVNCLCREISFLGYQQYIAWIC